jgi:hypothetical protein
MTDRKELAKVPGLTPEQQDEAVLNGLRGLVHLGDARAKAIGDELVAKDPSFRVRREAAEVLKTPPGKKP